MSLKYEPACQAVESMKRFARTDVNRVTSLIRKWRFLISEVTLFLISEVTDVNASCSSCQAGESMERFARTLASLARLEEVVAHEVCLTFLGVNMNWVCT